MEKLTEDRLKQANDIVKKVKLPTQPRVVIEISKEMGTSEPNFKKIADFISQDAALSAKVLNVINSPFFGVARKIESILQALSLMGLQNFNKVILTTCLREAMGGSAEASDQEFWDHSQRTAVAAETIANALSSVLLVDEITPDHAYLTGLFHDSAVPILLKRAPDYNSILSLVLSHKLDAFHDEDKLVGTDHCCVGAMLAKSWSLSSDICKAIMHHHVSDLGTIEKDKAPAKLIALLQVADYIAYTYDYSVGSASAIIEDDWQIEEFSEKHEAMLDQLQLNTDDLEDLKEEIFEKLSH